MPNRQDNGNGGAVALPPWLTFVFRVGVPSAIAVWFVFRLTTTMEDRLYRMEAIQQTVRVELEEHMRASKIAIDLARQLCINTAKDDEQTRACLRY
jgi:hypothetical protein